jgi:hypothetical protein
MIEVPTSIPSAPSGAEVVKAIRAKLLDGAAPVSPFAEAIDKTTRTVYVYIAQGMPVRYVGRTPYVLIDEALDWLRSRRDRQPAQPTRGRPRKASVNVTLRRRSTAQLE